jgi:hypothetical protein
MNRPQGVAVHHADGTITPCELAYQGINNEGVTVWKVATKVRFNDGDRLCVDSLPGMNAIAMPTDLEDLNGDI